MSVHTSPSRVVLPALLLSISISLILLCLATSLSSARAQPSSKTSHVTLDSDPLRRFLPPSNLYMKVPGAHWAVEDAQDSNAHFEELRDKRNYAQNFVKYGPYNQVLEATDDGIVSSLYSLWSVGMGAVQALEYLGLLLTQPKNSDTSTLHLATLQDQLTGVNIPRFEVRYLVVREEAV